MPAIVVDGPSSMSFALPEGVTWDDYAEGTNPERPLPGAPWFEPGAVRSVRRVLTQLIAETAQHAGHADILRETLDGRTSS